MQVGVFAIVLVPDLCYNTVYTNIRICHKEGATMQKANYHTHTIRCRHASGSERDFIETAIGAGMTTLGFSDHCPQCFDSEINQSGYYSDFRMRPEQAEDYVTTLLALREEYKDRIEIKIGYETEYYPAFFDAFLAFVGQYPCDYLILGQHFLDNESADGQKKRYSGAKTEDPAYLHDYVDQVCTAMNTGYFTYFAHPELQNFVGGDAVYRAEYSRLIRCAMDNHMPLEINMLGIQGNRHYPNEKFWALVGELGADVVIGCDAHEPASLADEDAYAKALALVERFGLRLVEPVLRKIH